MPYISRSDPVRLRLPARASIVLALVAALASAGAGAQERSGDAREVTGGDRPKIGLVLGGGGAKGGAHIGVLKVLEELHVPVDYIAGTSIGAAIGGLYASGMSVSELERLMESLDWKDLLSDRPARRHRPFRVKDTDRRIPSRLELGFNAGKFRLPTGFVTGQNVELMLRSATLPVAHIHAFKDLPIPFVAVATDLVTGEVVVLDDGELATAMRASMSIPGAFSPVEIDGRILVDGGLVRNLPVDVVRAMGADVVIAVDLTPPLLEAEELESALEVSAQTFRISVLQNTVPQREALLEGRDVLLRPDVEDVAVTEFRSLIGAIPAGEVVARANIGALRRWAVTPEEHARLSERRRPVETPLLVLDFIRIEGAERIDPDILRRRLDLPLGEPLTAEMLEQALHRVFAMGLYQGVDYSLERDGDAEGLLVRVSEKPWGPGLLRLGLVLGNDLERGRSSFTLLASHTQTQLNRRGGELLTEIRLGDAQAALVELFQPLDVGGRFFIAPRLEYREESLDVAVLGAGEVNRGIRELGAALAAGIQLRNWGELRVELRVGEVQRRDTGLDPTAVLDAAVGAILARFSIDVLDDRTFPTAGTWARFEAFRSARALGADPSYTRLEGSLLSAFTRKGTTLVLEARAGTAINSDLPSHHDFALGGFQQLSGYRAREAIGNRFGFGRATLRRKVATLPTTPQGGNLHVGVSIEAGNTWIDSGDVSFSDLRGGAAVFVGLESILGPVYLAYGRTASGSDTLFFFLGRAF